MNQHSPQLMTLVHPHELASSLNVGILSVSRLQWRIKTGRCSHWLCVSPGRASQCQRLKRDLGFVVYVRLILILKRDCDLIKDRRIIDAGIVVDEEISGDEHNRDGNDGHPYLRD